MIDENTIEKYDTSKMYEIYDKWPEIAEKSFLSNFEEVNFSEINHIIFAGMGGSGTIGDVFAAILSKSKIHVSLVKGYILPNDLDSKSLVIATSISGDTEEILSIVESAKSKECKILAISSGGKLEKYCLDNEIQFRKIIKIHSPRASFIGVLFSLFKILKNIIPINESEILESIKELKNLKENISSKNLSDTNIAIELAKKIDSIPLIYYPWGLNAAAIRFKNSLQENAKIHVIIEDVIEASHNGITSWENSSEIKPVLLQGTDDHIKTKERWKIIKEYFKDNKIEYIEIFSKKGSIVTKIINLIYLLDYISIYRAILTKTDPTPVKSIKFIKDKLNNI